MNHKVLLLVVVFSFLICSGSLIAKERRGAEVVITKTDGQQITGELVAVKPSSLLLLDSQTGADVSVETKGIAAIKIVKKAKIWIGLIGFGVGVAVGIPMGYLLVNNAGPYLPLVCGGIGGASFAALGTLIGAYIGKDNTIQITGKSPELVNAIMKKLRAQARITDFQ